MSVDKEISLNDILRRMLVNEFMRFIHTSERRRDCRLSKSADIFTKAPCPNKIEHQDKEYRYTVSVFMQLWTTHIHMVHI